MSVERDNRILGRSGLPRQRGHEAELGKPRSDLAAIDDYVGFCEGLRQICGIDLTQYKRPQMERRLRSYWTRLGIAKLTDALPLLRKDAAQLEDLLDRVTINVSQLWRHPDQWDRLGGGLLQELAASGPRPRVERRVLLRRRGLHAGGRVRRRDSHGDGPDSGHRHRPRMVARAKLAEFSAADARTAPAAADAALVRADPGRVARQGAPARDDHVRRRRSAQAPAVGVEL